MPRKVEPLLAWSLLVVSLAAPFALRAAEAPTVDDILTSKPSEEDYGTERRCVRSIAIERTEILSEKLIVFHMKRDDEKLLLQFQQRCPGLRRDVPLLYEKGDTSRICEHDTVQPRLDLGAASRWGPKCILPAFESVTAEQIEFLKAELRGKRRASTSSEATDSGL
jgi:hypothetical protein